jgi:magnesium-transporting ATPase (P-type)
VRFFYQFHNVLIYVLLVASGVTAMLGHWVDSGVILSVVVNAVIGFVQEGKAENALKEIRQMLSPQAMVLRDGQRLMIPSDELVPRDVVYLQSGYKVPVDLRLFKVKSLQVQGARLAVSENLEAGIAFAQATLAKCHGRRCRERCSHRPFSQSLLL